MKRFLFLFFSITCIILFITTLSFSPSLEKATGAPPYDPEGGNLSESTDFSWLSEWKRPDGAAKVALQVGHWKNEEVPEELHRLRGNTEAFGGGKSEWEVNYTIAHLTATLLEEKGVIVEILPATIPPRYWADVFIAIHADGNTDPLMSGYKAATPRRDYTGKAGKLLTMIEAAYEHATNLTKDTNITRNMKGYYAFSWWKYEHAVHPMTTSLILETGFLTSAADRKLIVDKPQVSARGLAEGIITFLQEEKLLTS